RGHAPTGTGQVKVGLILPLSAAGNAGIAAQSMKNAAEMALAGFNNPNIQLILKDDAGTSLGAQGAAARARNVPVIAFSTDANVAARGVYLLSFLPETDVDRIISYAVATGKR